MPLPSSIRTATLRFNNASLKLQANFANLEKLKSQTGRSPFDFIFTVMDMDDPDGMIETIRTLLVCLQADVEEYSEAQIHDWLFGGFSDFFNGDNLTHLNEVLGAIIGEDLKTKVPSTAPEPDTQKK